MKRIAIFTLVSLLFFVVPLKAETAPTGAELKALATKGDEGSERKFQLWNNCKPIHLKVVVKIMSLDTRKGLSLTNADLEKGITRMARNRLSSAYLYEPDAIPFLRIIVFGDYLSERISEQVFYFKPLHDPASGIYGLAPAWQSLEFDTQGPVELREQRRIVDSIQNNVSTLVDMFITDYQSVNADACK